MVPCLMLLIGSLTLANFGPTADARPALEVVDIDLETLTQVEYEEGKPLPAEVRKLDGETIRFRAFMDTNTTEEVTEFFVLGDSCGCEGMNVQHFVKVTLDEGVTGYRPELLTVQGKLEVGEEKDEYGFVTSIYRLTGATFVE